MAEATTDGMLAHITGPADVRALPAHRLRDLCAEIRAVLLRYGHEHGGHIGSNLGMVEATVALHRVFDSPRDRIVFDVSHQSYVHKMLTGRAAAYLDPARHGDVTGFTNPHESEHDHFGRAGDHRAGDLGAQSAHAVSGQQHDGQYGRPDTHDGQHTPIQGSGRDRPSHRML